MQDSRAPQSIDPEVLSAALAEPERLAAYLSQGTGPGGQVQGEQPEFVRVAVLTRAAPAAVQAAGEAWLAAAEALGVGPLRRIEAIELVAPTPGTAWAGMPADRRAALLRRGLTSLVALAPEVGVFHINDEFGAGMLLRLQSGAATGESRLDARLLEHMVFAALTYRLLTHAGEAVVVTAANDGTWSSRQVFPEHAAVWRRALISAPSEAVVGLGLAGLAEALVWATATRRGRAEVAAGPGVIATAIAEAEAELKPRSTNLLRERPGGGN
ncbi:hypothetical protein [Nannocystis sp. SCPEA4]|uniref:hypothetical protein n=1 Tax=Nannocystis sp. SCPEA4 TaxID=2996787 RepID=UPI00226E507C|nr:hypothetical protein [Nannocystis sp. SCPEA4]MCY1057457.1 hypothetical protein [Nannocystis sp. SCPEA4]